MPLYEYHCSDCNIHFDALVRNLSVADDVNCRECSGENVYRLVSRFGTVGGYDDQFTRQEAQSAGCCGGSCGCGH